MGSALHTEKKLPVTPWGCLPPQMRVLFISGQHRTGGWLAEALASDSASDVQLVEAVGIGHGLAHLRDELFDAVLVSHEVGGTDALEVLDAIRAGSSEDQPIVVLGEPSEQELAALCYEAGGDAYLCVHTTTTRALIWVVARAVERHALIAENRRLQQTQRHRLRLEHDEAHRLLEQQRAMIADLSEIRCDELALTLATGRMCDGPRARTAARSSTPTAQSLPRAVAGVRHHGSRQFVVGNGAVGRTAGLCLGHSATGHAIALAGAGRNDLRFGKPQCAARDEPCRYAGIGSDDQPGRAIPRSVPPASLSSTTTAAARF